MLEYLPSNILSSVFDHVSLNDLVKLSCLSKNLYVVVKTYAEFIIKRGQETATIDRSFIGRFKVGENSLFILFSWRIFSTRNAESIKQTPKLIQCKLEKDDRDVDRVADEIRSFYMRNYSSLIDVVAIDAYEDLVCCYLSDCRLVLLRYNSEKNSLEEVASNGNFQSAQIVKIQISDQFTIVADKYGIMFMLCSASLCKIKTFNQLLLRSWSPTFGLFPVSIIFTTIMNSFVVFICDDIGSFGLWHLSTGKIETFPGQILYNERTIKLIALGIYFVRISQDQCFNLIVDLYYLDDHSIKLLGCVGFINKQIDYKLKDIELEIGPNLVQQNGRPVKFSLKY